MYSAVATSVGPFGFPQGVALSDLTSPDVGNWPIRKDAIKKITNVVVYTGDIIDSVRITYDVEIDGVINPVTVKHGGNGGIPSLTLAIGADEKLIAVYGSRLVNSSPYGQRNIVQLSFVVVNTAGTVPTIQVYTASGVYGAPSEKFELTWPVIAASSYTFQPEGMPDAFLQDIGISDSLQ